MSAPYEFVNVTKSQYYRCPSSLVRHRVVEKLLHFFKQGVWDVNDTIVHGYTLIQAWEDLSEEECTKVDEKEKFGFYYNGTLLDWAEECFYKV